MENEQNKSTTPGIIVLIALILIICIVALLIWKSAHGGAINPNTSGAAVAQSIPVIPTAKTTVVNVSLTDTGYSPAVVTIHPGDAVTFTNNSQNRMWTASDPHPQHTGYPGFDEKSAGVSGAHYNFTFTNIGHWGYHNHLNPKQKGTVIVK